MSEFVETFGFCEFCERFGKVLKKGDFISCEECKDVFDMIFSAYMQEA